MRMNSRHDSILTRRRAFLQRTLLALLISAVLTSITRAQDDGLNLPTELYVLLNSGVVERYGVGAAGVQAVTPENAFVLDFAVSPDGDWLAYRTEENLILTSLIVEDAPDIVLEGTSADVPPARGRGETMVWSPGGDALAYTTIYGARVAFNLGQPAFANISTSAVYDLSWSPGGTYLALHTEPDVWWIFRRDGTQMNLASAIPVSRGIAWLADSLLLFAPDEGGLRTMDLSAANAQSLLHDATNLYLRPYIRPDNSIVVFSRPLDAADLGEYTGFFRRLTVTNGVVSVVESGETPVDLSGLRWAPRGDLLIAFRGGVLALVLPLSGEGFTLPIVNAVGYGWGAPRPDAVTGFTLTYDGFFLAPTTDGIIQVWRLPGNGLPAQPITTAPDDITDYTFSRDHLAYVSDSRIWLQPLAVGTPLPEAAELVSTSDAARDLAFNPAGDTLAYITLSTPDNPEGGVWLIPTAGGEAQLVLANELDPNDPPSPLFAYREPQFAPNMNALLVTRVTGEAHELFILDPTSGELFAAGRYARALWLSGGLALGIGWQDGAVLDVIDASLMNGEPATILRASNGTAQAVREIAPGRLRVVLTRPARPGETYYSLVDVNIHEGEPNDITDLDYMANPVISPDGEFIAGYSQPDGALLIYRVAQNQLVSLRSPGGISRFMWATFR